MGFMTTAVIAASAAMIGFSAYSAHQQSKAMKQSMPMPTTMAGAPATAENIIKESQAIAQETTLKKKKAMARSKSVFTSPMGLTEEAETAKKTLLGR